MTIFTETTITSDQTTTTLPGVVLARVDAPLARPDGTYGVGWLLRCPLRVGGWLAVALLCSIPVGLALAYWLTSTPRRAAVTATASLLTALATAR
jgi:hypothetical protein